MSSNYVWSEDRQQYVANPDASPISDHLEETATMFICPDCGGRIAETDRETHAVFCAEDGDVLERAQHDAEQATSYRAETIAPTESAAQHANRLTGGEPWVCAVHDVEHVGNPGSPDGCVPLTD